MDSEAPKALRFKEGDEVKVLPPEFMEYMAKAKRALQQPILVPPKSRFSKGKAVNNQFDSGLAEGHDMGSFVILDCDRGEVL